MAPFAVTAKALAMICSLQSRLAEISFVAVRPVAFFARWDLSGWTEVMAGTTVVSHLGHAGMQLMVKIHWLIKIGDLIQMHRVRCLGQFMLRLLGGVSDLKRRAGLETHILECRIGAGMAIQTIRH
jgi:hypothetical protein